MESIKVRISAMKISKIFDYIVKGIAVAIALILLAVIYFSHLRTVNNIHYNCNAKFEAEAHAIAAAIADYFSDPSKTQIPSIDDLVETVGYAPINSRRTKNRYKLVEESEYSIAILGENVSQITIVLSSKKGKCPFNKGECIRPYKGQYYVYKMYGDYGRAWKDKYP